MGVFHAAHNRLHFVMLDFASDVAYRVTAPVARIDQFPSLGLQHQHRRRVVMTHLPLDYRHAAALALRLVSLVTVSERAG